MPQAISSTQIQQLTNNIVNATDASSKQIAIGNAYTYLYDRGYDYAGWARGVAAQDTWAGISAMNFLTETAMIGVGSGASQTLSASAVLSIKTGMAVDYLNVLLTQAGRNGGINTNDINGHDVWQIHTDVFQRNNLSIENWTLDSVFKTVQIGYGDQGVEKVWQVIRDTGGDGIDGTAVNTAIVTFMAGASTSSNTSVSDLAHNWLVTVLPMFNPISDHGQVLNTINTWGTNNALNFTNVLNNTAQSIMAPSFREWLDLDNNISELYSQGNMSLKNYNTFTQSFSNWSVTDFAAPGMGISSWNHNFGLNFKTPIGAFYDSQNPVTDNSPSIAAKTPVFLNSANSGLTPAGLTALDVNADGKLNGTELTSVRAWADINENGLAEATEITALSALAITEVLSRDYGFYTRGNSRYDVAVAAPAKLSDVVPAAIAQPAVPVLPTKTDLSQPVPVSNYRTLRDTDNVYYITGGTITWTAAMVKINYNNKTYLIGTDGNDNFDANYYINDSQYFNLSLLVNFLGGNGNDTVGGSVRNDLIWGGLGNDTLMGYAGNDKLYGEEGDDQLQGREGADYLDGGIGIDTLFGGLGADVLNGRDGADYLAGDEDNDYLYGATGIDTLRGGVGNDYLDGGTENDNLQGEAGDDILFGGSGVDQLQGGDGNDRLAGEADNDVLFGQTGNDVLWGGDGNDNLQGFTASNEPKQTLLAGETDDDRLYGGLGFDTINGALGNDYIDGGDQNDVLFGGVGLDTIFGGTGDDQAQGEDGNDYIDGGTGNDLLFGLAGDDVLYGGIGVDELQGGYGNDRLSGDTLNDRLFGQTGNDTLYGGDGNDVLIGFTGSNDVKQSLTTGETDNDRLFGGNGADNAYGDLGDDYIDGGADNDLLAGDQGSDTVFGGIGNDQLEGNEGNDSLLGEAGDDRLFGQVGNDVLRGGDGNDILVGFTASNESKQSLLTGETDNDRLYGGLGTDLLIGGLGDDILHGEAGLDELQAGVGNDMLYGEEGDDRMFGQVGNDVLYGGAGNDILVGFTASNEIKQTLSVGESDNDWIYGGAGSDYILGGLGNDYLDGGAGADEMQGGVGDDTYIVNSVNDSILELTGAGYDTVISSSNYLLNEGIEALRLLDGFNIHGTGNSLNNLIIGNSGNNILDGVTGNDTMIGGRGDDTYYVDSNLDQITELASEGKDTVQSSISFTLGSQVEDLVLLDFSKPEKGLVDGASVLVYGYPKMNELDYVQGDAVNNFEGTCALTAIANLLTQANRQTSEAEVIQVAINNQWAVIDPNRPAYERGGSNYLQQQAILDSFGIRNDLMIGYNEQGIANLTMSGRGVIVALNAGVLWDEPAYVLGGGANHAVTVTGVAYNEADGALKGFFIADSGRHKVSDMTRYVSVEKFRAAAGVANGYSIYTLEPLKLWDENINGLGNDLNNVMVGNRGDNVLNGYGGNDVLDGGAGIDTLIGGSGNDTYVMDNVSDVVTELAAGGIDTIQSTFTYTLGAEFENLTLIGAAAINGAGNALNNVMTGNSDINTLAGGLGNDTYIIEANDIVIEAVNAGTDTVQIGTTYSLINTNIENLVLIGSAAINATGNSAANTITGNNANNILDGGVGVDTLIGGAGNDTYIVDNSAEIITELSTGGIDLVQSSVTFALGIEVENLYLTGSAAINGIGNILNNAIYANAGNNILDGGAGTDTVSYAIGSTTGVTANLSLTTAQVTGGSGTDTLLNIESIVGSNYNDTLTGNSGNNGLTGGLGNDTLVGGLGNDAYVIDVLADVVTELAGGGTDIIYSSISYNLADTDGAGTNGGNVENLYLSGTATINGTGNALNNAIYANTGNNILDGSTGADTVSYGYGATSAVNVNLSLTVVQATGGSGSDTLLNIENLVGSNYNDTLFGSTIANSINGGTGNDTINGKAGIDSLAGSTGLDNFVFDLAGTANKDTISDFIVADDTIWLENAYFTKYTVAGALTAGTFVSGAGAKALDANDYLIYNTSTGTLSYDADGNGVGAQVDIVTLTGIPALTAADFLIV